MFERQEAIQVKQIAALVGNSNQRCGAPQEIEIGYTSNMNRRLTKISKYLSFILRHHPEKIGLTLDSERWANVESLVEKANANGKAITLAQVHQVVELNEQKIFVLSDDGLRIRAN
ncbi:MAG: RNA 2'-phosphotransferase [Mariniblastus sp.]|nr:RNA 2'-phosphotransferase [Mariniblastus sp.]